MAKVEEKKETINIAVYKANLHCPKCAHDIQKPLMRTPGVHKVDVKHEKGEIKVEGTFEVKKIHERLEKWSRKKVDILSQDKKPMEKLIKETKKETIKTTKLKAYMHCEKCEHDLRAKLLKHKGIHNVKTDIKSQTVLIEGTIEAEKIVTYMQKRARKHAEIIPQPPPKEKVEKKVEEKVVVDVVTTKIVEFEEKKKAEAKGEAPYFVHYVYAPQLFSDENPNACLVL